MRTSFIHSVRAGEKFSIAGTFVEPVCVCSVHLKALRFI